MNSHLLRIALASIAAIPLTMPVAAQQRGRGMLPAQRRAVAVPVAVPDDGSPRPQAFSVSLVLGDMQAVSGPDNVPAAARRALTDVKDFLPYKAYRLLDSQWTLCCGRPEMGSSRIVSRLRGPDDQDYSIELDPRNAGNGKWSVHFSLWEPRAERIETAVTPMRSLEQQRVELEHQLAELRKTNGDSHPDVVRLRRRLESLDSQSVESRRDDFARRTLTASMPRRAVIDTSFTMDVGETVVVGTSRLKGDKALIALLTAVAPTKPPAR
jgi:hypothetical protein